MYVEHEVMKKVQSDRWWVALKKKNKQLKRIIGLGANLLAEKGIIHLGGLEWIQQI